VLNRDYTDCGAILRAIWVLISTRTRILKPSYGTQDLGTFHVHDISNTVPFFQVVLYDVLYRTSIR